MQRVKRPAQEEAVARKTPIAEEDMSLDATLLPCDRTGLPNPSDADQMPAPNVPAPAPCEHLWSYSTL